MHAPDPPLAAGKRRDLSQPCIWSRFLGLLGTAGVSFRLHQPNGERGTLSNSMAAARDARAAELLTLAGGAGE